MSILTSTTPRIRYVTFRHKEDRRPEPHEVGWDALLTLLMEHRERPSKDGPAFSPVVYREGAKRGNAGVIAMTAVVADLDSGVDWEEQQARLEGLEWVAWSTHSYTPENGKCRVVLPLASPVPAAQWPDLFRRINHHLFDGLIDQATKDPARLHYLASHEPGALYFVKHQQGALLDPYSLGVAPAEPSATNGRVKHTGSIPQIGRDAAEFIAFGAKDGEQRSRALRTGRNLLAAGYTVEQVAEKLLQGLRNSPSDPAKAAWTEADALRIASSLASSEPTPPEKIEGVDIGRVLLAPARSAALRVSGTNGDVHVGEVEPPNSDADAPACDDVPSIDASEQDLRIITAEAWDALALSNDYRTRMFKHGGLPTRLETDDHGRPVLRELTPDRMRHELARAAEFFIMRRGGDRKVVVPPNHVAHDLLATANPPLPVITRITEAPSFAPNGALQTTRGYHPTSQVYCAMPQGLDIPEVPTNPTAEDVERAKALILGEQLAEFPFVDQPDRANAVGLGIDPYVRDMVDGPTPLRIIEAPMPGSGKGLLAEALLRPACGRNIGAIAQARDDDEWRKRLTAILRDGHPAVQIDNVTRALDSGALSMALTIPYWTDRILGVSMTVRLPVRCVWVATANNPSLSTEIARRSIRIRLDPRVDRPWEREGFRHPELLTWVDEHRGELIWANLVLIQSWIAAGRPVFSGRALGSYERWSHVIGGILEHAGIDGFLGNLSEFYEQSDVETTVWRAFVESWWEKHQSNEVGTADLFPIAVETEGFDLGRGGNERSQKTVFGKALGKQRDRIVGGYRIAQVGTRDRAARWRLLGMNVLNIHERSMPLIPRVRDSQELLPTEHSGETFMNVQNVHPDSDIDSPSNPDKTQRRCACGKLTKDADRERCFDCRVKACEIVNEKGWVYTEREQYEDPHPTLALPLETATPDPQDKPRSCPDCGELLPPDRNYNCLQCFEKRFPE